MLLTTWHRPGTISVAHVQVEAGWAEEWQVADARQHAALTDARRHSRSSTHPLRPPLTRLHSPAGTHPDARLRRVRARAGGKRDDRDDAWPRHQGERRSGGLSRKGRARAMALH
eukprot:scaffold47669_cov58-Phaeocystis_antarctica.AAC.4